MPGWSPPSVPREWLIAIGVAYAALLGYGLIIAQQLLLFGLLPAVFLVVVYLLWRFLAAIEAIADALQRLAHQREQK